MTAPPDRVPEDPRLPGRHGDPPAPEALPSRQGLPDEETILTEKTVTSPKGRRYRIIKTSQRDPYDEATNSTPEAD